MNRRSNQSSQVLRGSSHLRQGYGGQAGQVGIIVLLIMVVMTTLGVSIASRSVTELKLSRQEEESTRALDLAEGGAEQILSDLGTYSGNTGSITVGGEDVDYNVVAVDSITNMSVFEGHTLQVDLADATTTASSLTISWPRTGSIASCGANDASIVVAIIDDSGNVNRQAFGCARTDNFSNPTNEPSSPDRYEVIINSLPANPAMARIKVLYNDAALTVTGVGLPVQVAEVNTTYNNPDDGTTRAVQVNRLAGSLPSIFDYVLFSGGSLVKP